MFYVRVKFISVRFDKNLIYMRTLNQLEKMSYVLELGESWHILWSPYGIGQTIRVKRGNSGTQVIPAPPVI